MNIKTPRDRTETDNRPSVKTRFKDVSTSDAALSFALTTWDKSLSPGRVAGRAGKPQKREVFHEDLSVEFIIRAPLCTPPALPPIKRNDNLLNASFHTPRVTASFTAIWD